MTRSPFTLAPALAVAFAAAAALAPTPARAQTAGDSTFGGTPRLIRLADAIQLAESHAPAAVAARGQIRTANAAVHSAYAAFIPNVNLSASTTRQGTGNARVDNSGQVIASSLPWLASQGFSLNVDLFDGGRRFFDIASTHAQVNAAQANDVTQRYNTALQVEQQFFAVLAARESASAARAQLAQAQAQLATAVAKVKEGTATKSDSLRAVIQVGNAQLALLTAQNSLQTGNAALSRLVAAPYPVTASPEDTVGETTLRMDSSAIAGLALDGPLVRQASANVTAAEAASRAAKSPYLPTVSVSYSRGRNGGASGFTFTPGGYQYTSQLRFGISYPLFNQFQRESGIVQADVAAKNARATLRDTRLQAQQTLVQYLGAMRTAQQQMTVQEVSVAAGEEDLRVQEQRYGLGASTQLDVLTSETTLNQARAALIQARYDFRVAKAQIEALIGRPL